MRRKLIILGSTGSIGFQTLDYIRENRDKFEVVGLGCEKNIDKLKRQILEFSPHVVSVVDIAAAGELKKWADENKISISVAEGSKGLFLTAQYPADLLVNAIVGEAAVEPTLFALQTHRPVAMAAKEAIVAAGKAIMRASYENNSPIIPIDSEMSGIFQCLLSRKIDPFKLYNKPSDEIEKIILTCSGGPFYDKSDRELEGVTREEVLAHPTWPDMGPKNLVDSAALINKGLEVIEAMYLFNVPAEKIEVVIHRESLVHAIVQFSDGSLMAQMSERDMKIPIAYALNYPHTAPSEFKRMDFSRLNLRFEKPDFERFPALKFAYDAARRGGEAPRNFMRTAAKLVNKFLISPPEVDFLHVKNFTSGADLL